MVPQWDPSPADASFFDRIPSPPFTPLLDETFPFSETVSVEDPSTSSSSQRGVDPPFFFKDASFSVHLFKAAPFPTGYIVCF